MKLSEEERESLRFAKYALGYLFHHEPNQRMEALDSMTVIDKVLEETKPNADS